VLTTKCNDSATQQVLCHPLGHCPPRLAPRANKQINLHGAVHQHHMRRSSQDDTKSLLEHGSAQIWPPAPATLQQWQGRGFGPGQDGAVPLQLLMYRSSLSDVTTYGGCATCCLRSSWFECQLLLLYHVVGAQLMSIEWALDMFNDTSGSRPRTVKHHPAKTHAYLLYMVCANPPLLMAKWPLNPVCKHREREIAAAMQCKPTLKNRRNPCHSCSANGKGVKGPESSTSPVPGSQQ
jgi:hypothetical protein